MCLLSASRLGRCNGGTITQPVLCAVDVPALEVRRPGVQQGLGGEASAKQYEAEKAQGPKKDFVHYIKGHCCPVNIRLANPPPPV